MNPIQVPLDGGRKINVLGIPRVIRVICSPRCFPRNKNAMKPTEGLFNGESLDGWSIASGLQCQAAMRMLYYFPQETSQLLADRLVELDVSGRGKGVTNFIAREVKNGVRAKEFIKAVAWSGDPPIRRELSNILNRTTDTEIARIKSSQP